MLTRVFNFTEKMLNFTQYVTYKGPLGKSVFLKIVAQAFEAGYSLKILLRFSGFRESCCCYLNVRRTVLFIRKSFICLSLNIFNMLESSLRFF